MGTGFGDSLETWRLFITLGRHGIRRRKNRHWGGHESCPSTRWPAVYGNHKRGIAREPYFCAYTIPEAWYGGSEMSRI